MCVHGGDGIAVKADTAVDAEVGANSCSSWATHLPTWKKSDSNMWDTSTLGEVLGVGLLFSGRAEGCPERVDPARRASMRLCILNRGL
jgi:hypothetical protein